MEKQSAKPPPSIGSPPSPQFGRTDATEGGWLIDFRLTVIERERERGSEGARGGRETMWSVRSSVRKSNATIDSQLSFVLIELPSFPSLPWHSLSAGDSPSDHAFVRPSDRLVVFGFVLREGASQPARRH